MINNKKQKEINKSINHLLKYVEKPKWSILKQDYYGDMWTSVAEELSTTDEEIIHGLMQGNYLSNTLVFLFENFITLHFEDDEPSMLEEYIKQRGWRETPYARQYLRALEKATIGLFEIMDSKKGAFVDVRELGCDEVQRIYDYSTSQNAPKFSWLATKVITVKGKKMFSGSCLHFNIDSIEELFADITNEREVASEIINKRNQDNPNDEIGKAQGELLADMHISMVLPDIIFNSWVINAYLVLTKHQPVILNKDDELFKQVDVVFPIAPEDKKNIITRLNDADFLDNVEKNKKWAWLGCHKNKIPELGTTLLGEFTLTNKNIKLSANSENRAKKGQEYIKKLLKGLIGSPLITEKSMQDLLADTKSSRKSANTNLLENSEESKTIISNVLTEHYKKTLDEKIPTLDNKTPRQCAQDKKMKLKLIQWLKGLESSSSNSTQMQDYSFQWMWEELSLKYPNT